MSWFILKLQNSKIKKFTCRLQNNPPPTVKEKNDFGESQKILNLKYQGRFYYWSKAQHSHPLLLRSDNREINIKFAIAYILTFANDFMISFIFNFFDLFLAARFTTESLNSTKKYLSRQTPFLRMKPESHWQWYPSFSYSSRIHVELLPQFAGLRVRSDWLNENF